MTYYIGNKEDFRIEPDITRMALSVFTVGDLVEAFNWFCADDDITDLDGNPASWDTLSLDERMLLATAVKSLDTLPTEWFDFFSDAVAQYNFRVCTSDAAIS